MMKNKFRISGLPLLNRKLQIEIKKASQKCGAFWFNVLMNNFFTEDSETTFGFDENSL